MKTFAKYIMALSLLALAVSCENPWFTEDDVKADSVKVTLSLHFPEPIPVATKGHMAEGPSSSEDFEIYLCLYGSGGYVQNWVKAKMESTTVVDGYITGGEFSAWLTITDESRTVHVIANPPVTASEVTQQYMDLVMKRMVTTKGTDAECSYWQQVDLPNGIHAGSGYEPDTATKNAFKNIYLVRNFAKVSVTSATAGQPGYQGFEVKRWTLINVPDKGFVAPYMGETATKPFPKGYLNIQNYYYDPAHPETLGALYKQLTGVETGQDNYKGYMPPQATIDESFPSDLSKYANRAEYQYLYERPLPTSNHVQTAVLVEVTFDAEHNPAQTGEAGTYWYKIELLNNKGEYVPLLRDIIYTLNIKGIDVVGASSAEAAYNGAYFGNISASLETASLNELSNGESLIHVDLMDYTFLTGDMTVILGKTGSADENPAQFFFKPDETQTTTYTVSTPGICDIQVALLAVDGYDPAVTANSLDAGSTGTLTVHLEGTSSDIKKSIIRVSARKGDNVADNPAKYIYRDIMITLMEKQRFKHGETLTSITYSSEALTTKDATVTLKINLPEGLSASVFPVQVRIEAENNTLSAKSSNLPTKTGLSAFASKAGKNTFYYIYTINYSDYCKLNPATLKYDYFYEFPCTLYTNSTNNSTAIDIRELILDPAPDPTAEEDPNITAAKFWNTRLSLQ